MRIQEIKIPDSCLRHASGQAEIELKILKVRNKILTVKPSSMFFCLNCEQKLLSQVTFRRIINLMNIHRAKRPEIHKANIHQASAFIKLKRRYYIWGRSV